MSDSIFLQTVPEDWHTALAVVAHPDDLEYGAASAIARWTAQGKDVAYLLITKGEAGIDCLPPDQASPVRMDEERAGALAVGVRTVDFLDYPDGTIEYSLTLRRDIARAVREHRPDTIISINPHHTWGGTSWNSADHRAVGAAVVDGLADASNRWIFRELVEEGLEPWQDARFILLHGSPAPTHAIDVAGYLDAGIESLLCHKEYLAGLGQDFDPAGFLRSEAEREGKLLGCELAVSFELVSL